MNYMFQVDLLDGDLDYSEQGVGSADAVSVLNEQAPSPAHVLDNLNHPTTKWYTPIPPVTGSAATSHCDGTPIIGNQSMYLLQGPASSITWSMNQDINFDGQLEVALQGYSDWDNIDLRQIGATANTIWAAGKPLQSTTGGGKPLQSTTGGGKPLQSTTGGGKPLQSTTGGGVGEITLQAASSTVRKPTVTPPLTFAANQVQGNFQAPGFGQSQIASFNIYRSVNGAPFSPPAYANFSIAGKDLTQTLTFTDAKVSCATYSYFVTTVLSDGRESLPSDTLGPISVPCTFVGFISPMSTASQAPAPPTFSGSRNLGNAIPIKWELQDGNGNPIADLTTLKLMQACPTTGPTTAPASSTRPPCVPIYSPLNGGEGSTTFRYSAPYFIINYDTGSSSMLTHGYWTIELQLSDGRIEWTNLLF